MALSQRQYAKHRASLGLDGGSQSGVKGAIDSGRLLRSLTKDRKIRDAAAADLEWAETTKADRVPHTGPTSNGNGHAPNPLQEHRARREAAEARLAEIALEEKERSLVRAADVESHLVNVIKACQTKLLGLVARARAQDPSLSAQQLAMFDRILREALEDLSNGNTQ